jgi:cytidine deaminase
MTAPDPSRSVIATNTSVGCAVLTSDNKIYMGANVENASYGGAICAERVAITRAIVSKLVYSVLLF